NTAPVLWAQLADVDPEANVGVPVLAAAAASKDNSTVRQALAGLRCYSLQARAAGEALVARIRAQFPVSGKTGDSQFNVVESERPSGRPNGLSPTNEAFRIAWVCDELEALVKIGAGDAAVAEALGVIATEGRATFRDAAAQAAIAVEPHS